MVGLAKGCRNAEAMGQRYWRGFSGRGPDRVVVPDENDYHNLMQRMRFRAGRSVVAAVTVSMVVVACGGDTTGTTDRASVVVSTPILGAIVADIVGEAADVKVLMPNGVDPHQWEASPKEIEALSNADIVVINGLHLEESLEEAIDAARRNGVRVFEAADHVDVIVGSADESSDEHADGDPHIWTDAAAMADVALALGDAFAEEGIDVGDRASVAYERLSTLDHELLDMVATLEPGERKLVTGHESLAYLARRYGFDVVGAVVPGLSSESEVSAGELASLEDLIGSERVDVIFSEVGTPDRVVEAIADETGARVVELDTHRLPTEGGYEAFMRDLVSAIVSALSS